jgi:cytochrome c oxidase assembly protein subunit 11
MCPPMGDTSRHKKQNKKNRRLIFYLVCGVLFMFGFCYMLVPLYRLVCRQQGINGQAVRSASAVDPAMRVDTSRVIHVTFTTTLHGGLEFKFMPLERTVDIHPGERKLIYFFAENQTGRELTVQAIPSITPVDAARFLKKTECFCFTQQYFFKNERADMPVYFFVEPDIPNNIREITLSYTLFDASGFEKKGQQFRKGRISL